MDIHELHEQVLNAIFVEPSAQHLKWCVQHGCILLSCHRHGITPLF